MGYNPEGLTSIDFKLEVYSPPSGSNLIFELKEEQGNAIRLVGRVVTDSSCNLNREFVTSLLANSITTSSLSLVGENNLISDYLITLNSSTKIITNLNLFQAYNTTLKVNSIIVSKLELLHDRMVILQGTINSSFDLNLILPILIRIKSLGSLDLFKEPLGLQVELNSRLAIRFKLIPNYSLKGNNRRVYLLDEKFELVVELDVLVYNK